MLDGAFDFHVHFGPDVHPRKTTALELAQAAAAVRMSGLLLKNHDVSTVAVAATLRDVVDLRVFGGLALNHAVGCFNVYAAETALRMGAAEIWMPTHSAENERRYRGRPGTGMTIYDCDGRLLDPVKEILKLIAEYQSILGTGHLSPQEIVDLIAAARDAGVRKILVTHPEIVFVDLPVSVQRQIAGPDVFFERCFVREGFCLDWDGLAKTIREVGVASTVLATDLGQPNNPHPVEGLRQMKEELAFRGFTESELRRMMNRNPAVLLNLE